MKQLITIFLVILSVSAYGQAQFEAPYQKNPSLPAFNMLMLDSTDVLNGNNIPSGRPVILIMFSPDCNHCEQLTDSIVKHMDRLAKARIYMVTPMYLPAIKEFYKKKQLSKHKNIVVGKDYEFFFPKFYNAYDVPFIVVYNRNKTLVKAFGQHNTITEIIEAIQ